MTVIIVFDEGELRMEATVAKFATTACDGKKYQEKRITGTFLK